MRIWKLIRTRILTKTGYQYIILYLFIRADNVKCPGWYNVPIGILLVRIHHVQLHYHLAIRISDDRVRHTTSWLFIYINKY